MEMELLKRVMCAHGCAQTEGSANTGVSMLAVLHSESPQHTTPAALSVARVWGVQSVTEFRVCIWVGMGARCERPPGCVILLPNRIGARNGKFHALEVSQPPPTAPRARGARPGARRTLAHTNEWWVPSDVSV